MKYTGEYTKEISFPLGGIGTGSIGLGGDGRLIDWEIFNRPAKGTINGYSHFAIKAIEDEKVKTYVLCGDVLKDYYDKPEKIVYFSPALNYSDASAQRKRYEGFISVIGDTKYSVVTNIDEIKNNYGEKTVVICSNDCYAMQVYFKGTNARITGFDNINAISKYKLHIDSVGYSMAKIANAAVEIIKENKKESTIVEYFLTESSM